MKTKEEMLEIMDNHFYGLELRTDSTRKEMDEFGINISDVWLDLDTVIKKHFALAIKNK